MTMHHLQLTSPQVFPVGNVSKFQTMIGWLERKLTPHWLKITDWVPCSNSRALSTLSHIARKICKKCVSDSQCQISNMFANIRFRNPIWCICHNMDEDVKFYPHDKIIKISYHHDSFCWPRLVVIKLETSPRVNVFWSQPQSSSSLSARDQTIISFLD